MSDEEIDLDDLLNLDIQDSTPELETEVAEVPEVEAPAPAPKKRGRPRKVVEPEPVVEDLPEGVLTSVTDEVDLSAFYDKEPAVEAPVEAPKAKPALDFEKVVSTPPEETEADKRIAALEAQLAAAIKALEVAATVATPTLENSGFAPVEPLPTEPGAEIVFHVIEDGFTFGGRVFYRGEEIRVIVGSKAYNETFDRDGNTSLDLLIDEAAQYRRYRGRVMVSRGPWKGMSKEEGIRAALAANEATKNPLDTLA